VRAIDSSQPPRGSRTAQELEGICLSIMLSGNASMHNICRHFGLQLNIFDHSTLYHREAARVF